MGRNTYRQSFRPQSDFAETEANSGAGRGGGYSRNYRPQNSVSEQTGVGTSSDSPALRQRGTDLPTVKENGADVNGMISGIEKRLSGVQQDFKEAIQKVSEKENEKFDLIFAILSELQSRQASLEESVRSLKAQFGNGMVANGSQPQQQFGSSGGQFGQMNGQMGGQMNGSMGNQQPMQQFTGVMQADGTQAMFTPMTQMMIVQSPANGSMQYAVPQMMTPTGAVVQQMPAQMAMQFVGQSSGPEMGLQYGGGQEVSGTQGQMSMGGNSPIGMMNKPQDVSEVGLMNGESSSQEGKIDEGSPGQLQSPAELVA